MPTPPEPPFSIDSLEELDALAAARIPGSAYDYIAGGSGDEWTLRESRAAWARVQVVPRMLRGVAVRDLSTTVVGQKVSMPALVAPMAFHGLCHPDAELATARAAAACSTVFVTSTLSNLSLEVIAAASGPRWFQLYVYRDRGVTRDLVARAVAAGYTALCVTVDTPLVGARARDRRNHFSLPKGMAIGNFTHRGSTLPDSDGSALAGYVSSLLDPGLVWRDLEWMASLSRLPLIVKGILAAEDGITAVEHGARAIVVSSHGGRQLDGAPATVSVLPHVVDAIEGRAEVLVDGGIRRGADVLRALALGARAVLIGRPILWGLVLGGEGGVRVVLEHLRGELDLALALAGCSSIGEVGRHLVWAPKPGSFP